MAGFCSAGHKWVAASAMFNPLQCSMNGTLHDDHYTFENESALLE